jgi:hypothetical protein
MDNEVMVSVADDAIRRDPIRDELLSHLPQILRLAMARCLGHEQRGCRQRRSPGAGGNRGFGFLLGGTCDGEGAHHMVQLSLFCVI